MSACSELSASYLKIFCLTCTQWILYCIIKLEKIVNEWYGFANCLSAGHEQWYTIIAHSTISFMFMAEFLQI